MECTLCYYGCESMDDFYQSWLPRCLGIRGLQVAWERARFRMTDDSASEQLSMITKAMADI
jgi:hypothetical protein